MFVPIVNIPEERNYWLVRTEAGNYYSEFYHEDFIGIGWTEIKKWDIASLMDEELMNEHIQVCYPDKQAGRILGQIKRFVLEMKPGDIVLIPSESSRHITFGKIESDVYDENVKLDDILEGVCPFIKRRKVTWEKTVSRDELDPYLYKLLNSHHTITSANDYASFIDRTLNSFYIKDGMGHLVLNVKTREKISGMDLLTVVNSTLNLASVLNEVSEEGPTYDKRDIELKISVQSPGLIEFIAAPVVIMGIGFLIRYLVGGTIQLKGRAGQEEQVGIELRNQEGLVEKVLRLRSNQEEAEALGVDERYKQSMKNLKVEIPQELESLPELEAQEDK